MSFLWQKRLNEGASDLLKHYYVRSLERAEKKRHDAFAALAQQF